MSIQRGELKVLIDLLERDPAGVNACDEVRIHVSFLNKYSGTLMTRIPLLEAGIRSEYTVIREYFALQIFRTINLRTNDPLPHYR